MSDLALEINPGTDFLGALLYCQDGSGDPFPLAGWTAYAEVRKDNTSPVILDLAPVIAADDTAGLITIPGITPDNTEDLPEDVYQLDVLLKNPGGDILPDPLLTGTMTISRTITRAPAA